MNWVHFPHLTLRILQCDYCTRAQCTNRQQHHTWDWRKYPKTIRLYSSKSSKDRSKYDRSEGGSNKTLLSRSQQRICETAVQRWFILCITKFIWNCHQPFPKPKKVVFAPKRNQSNPYETRGAVTERRYLTTRDENRLVGLPFANV